MTEFKTICEKDSVAVLWDNINFAQSLNFFETFEIKFLFCFYLKIVFNDFQNYSNSHFAYGDLDNEVHSGISKAACISLCIDACKGEATAQWYFSTI